MTDLEADGSDPVRHPLRVLDLSQGIAEDAGRMLVGLGAEVLRVEPRGGAASRPCSETMHARVGQRVVQLDDDVALGRLAAGADVVLESGPVATLRGVRFEGDEPRSRWPHLPHVVVTPFGLTGPKRDWAADDLVLTAAGGMAWLGGRPEGQPKPPPREQGSQLAAANAATAALLGVIAGDRFGIGQLIDVSAQEAVAATLETGTISWLAARSIPRRSGGVYAHVAHRLFATADNYVAGGYSGSDRMWTDLLAWLVELGVEEDLADPVWSDPEHRWRERAHVDEVVARFAARLTSAELGDGGRKRALPWAEIATAATLPDNPQLRSREYLLTIRAGDGTTFRDVGFGFESPALSRPIELQAPGVPQGGAQELDWRGPQRAGGAASWQARATDGRILSGLRVLDLTWVLAGPYATKQLAEFGADVIKIESIHRQDPTRFSPGMRLRPDATYEDGAYFLNFNRNKRSVAVNMREPRGVEIVRRLGLECDVVVENFAPGVLARWGLDYWSLAAQRPDIVVASMSGVGQTGPWRSAVTFADTLAAMSGLSDETRDPGGAPQGLTFGLGDMVAGNAAVLAILDRLRLQDGGAIDLSQLEAMTTNMGSAVLEAQLGDALPSGSTRDRPNRHALFVPHGLYPVRGDDRWLALSVTDAAAWRRLAALVPALAPYAEHGLEQRRREEDALDGLLEEWTRDQDGAGLAWHLQTQGIAASVVATGADLADHDEHLTARGFYVDLDHPTAGTIRHEGIVARFAATPGALRTAAPLLGEHTAEVLTELLDVSLDDVSALRAAGVLV